MSAVEFGCKGYLTKSIFIVQCSKIIKSWHLLLRRKFISILIFIFIFHDTYIYNYLLQYLLMSNTVFSKLSYGSLYVDDFIICCKSKYIHIIEWKLQLGLKKISRWTTENGFKFSETKTK